MTGTITALKIQKRNRERVNVYLDGNYALAVTTLAASQLRTGQYLSEADIATLETQDARERAYQSAIRYLGYRPRSEQEIRRHLDGKKVPAEVVEMIVDRLHAESHLDDQAFASYWIDNRERFKPRSRKALRYELWQKGVPKTIIESALAGVDEAESAWQAVASRLHRWRGLDERLFQQKAGGFLARRGFSYATIKPVLKRAWQALAQGGLDASYD
jgi:regulatory protein